MQIKGNWKKIILLLGIMLGFSSFDAVADNETVMVTYFPVPYASFNTLYISNKLDIGTQNSPFILELGSTESTTSLSAETLNLLRGTLDLKVGDVYSNSARFGKLNESAPGMAKLQFANNLKIKITDDDVIEKLTVKGTLTAAHLKLGSKELPSCPNSVMWESNLTIAGKTGTFLVCP